MIILLIVANSADFANTAISVCIANIFNTANISYIANTANIANVDDNVNSANNAHIANFANCYIVLFNHMIIIANIINNKEYYKYCQYL